MAPEHTNERTGLYAAAVRRVADECNVIVADVYSAMSSAGKASDFLCDGLHLNDKGNKFVFDLVKKTIEDRIPHLTRGALPREMPEVRALIGPPQGRLEAGDSADNV